MNSGGKKKQGVNLFIGLFFATILFSVCPTMLRGMSFIHDSGGTRNESISMQMNCHQDGVDCGDLKDISNLQNQYIIEAEYQSSPEKTNSLKQQEILALGFEEFSWHPPGSRILNKQTIQKKE